MSTSSDPLPSHWHYYAELADLTHRGRADALGQAREEQLWETLLAIEKGVPFNPDTEKRLDRMAWNRQKKHARLQRRLAQAVTQIAVKVCPTEVTDSVEAVKRKLTHEELQVELRLASGESYRQIADEGARSLKMRVSRWRERVRLHGES